MNVLVTGAAGFVGGHLVKELKDNGHEVVAAINNSENPIAGVRCVSADLSVADEVNKSVDFKSIDAVIHLAGLAAVGPSFDAPLHYITVNAGIEINLYEACILQNAKPKFLIISSGSLYDPKSQMPIDEESPVVASSPYSVSKITQESLAKYYGNRGFEYVIARPFNHIGPGQNPGFIVPDFAKQIVVAEKGEATKIMVGNLEAKRDYTDVRDIAKAYRLLVESDKAVGQTFNICSGNSVSGQEILDKLLTKSEVRLKIAQDPERMRPSDIPEIIGDHSKISSAIGWQPQYSIDQSLQDALDDWRNR
jgi:GDP-4-dehydro-6-deoxy-D-mannose reductase